MPVHTVHQAFEQHAQKNGDSTALICCDRSVSYGEFSQTADTLARVLQQCGAGPGTLVGLSGERSIELVFGLMAILKSGAGYVPLDPSYPPERINHIIDDAGLILLLKAPTTSRRMQFVGIEHMCVSIEDLDLTKSGAPIQLNVTAEDPAAVIYTSGTSGKPKGVVIPHRAIISRRDDLREYLDETTTSLWGSSISVIGHISSLLLPLMTGKKIVIATETLANSPRKLAEMMTQNSIARIALVPSQLRGLLDCEEFLRANTLKTIVLSGEAVTPALLRLAKSRMPAVAIVNAYGTTETTGLVSRAKVTDPDRVIIGATGLGSKMLILDSELNEVAIGAPGELCVTGPQLAAGYLHDAQLTDECFVSHHLGGSNQRMYRTGDIARCTHDGLLEILGRRDQQVKVRGFRVNLAEVESVLERHQSVERAVVILENGFPHAYLQATGTLSEIQAYVYERLPSFMVPRSFRIVPEFPLLPNGKTDRLKVRNEHGSKWARLETTNPSTIPSEVAVAGIFEEVFEILGITASDSFFDLGGDSLHSMQILAKIGARYNIELTPKQLFDNPTVSALSGLIESAAL